MSEESTTSDLVELLRQSVDAHNRGDWDAVVKVFASDPVWDASRVGIGVFTGLIAVRGFMEDWRSTFGEHTTDVAEMVDMGNGNVFVVFILTGSLAGGNEMAQRYAAVYTFVDGLCTCVTTYLDIDEARAAAECLAEERG